MNTHDNESHCKYCTGATYTDKPFKVTTQLGTIVKAVFNFCPVCGRKLRDDC